MHAGLTLPLPDILAATLDGRQPEAMTLPGLMEGVPVDWDGDSSFVDIQCFVENVSMTAIPRL
jgi:hypothetical protein